MVRKCIVCGEGTHIFQFPSREPTRSKWIDAISGVIDKLYIGDYHGICESHFTEDCFIISSGYRLRLANNSIPTLLLRKKEPNSNRQYKPAPKRRIVEKIDDSPEQLTDPLEDTTYCARSSAAMVQERKSDPKEEILALACERLRATDNEFELLARSWATDLQKMDTLQQVFAKKAISDVIFEGMLGTLQRDSVVINAPTMMHRIDLPQSTSIKYE